MGAEQPAKSSKGLVLRNTLLLVGAQILGTPLSIAVNAVMGRYLDAADFGRIYLISTMSQLGFVLVDWGHNDFLPSAVARDRGRAGEWLGATLFWRLAATVLMTFVLVGICLVLHYEREIFVIMSLIVGQQLCCSLIAGLQNTVRGFERADVSAVGQVGYQLLVVVTVVPTLVLGGRLRSALLANLVAAIVAMIATLRVVRSLGLAVQRFSRDTLRALAVQGAPFLVFSIVMMLQSNVDAVLLSKLSNETVVGWHAVARRLIGALVMPASAVISAMYPTLSRLHVEDEAGFVRVTRSALAATAALGAPLALCCGLYGIIGVRMFGEASFGAAVGNLQVLAPFVFLLYLSMPLSSALLAAGQQKRWAAVQVLAVVLSAVLDPILIPWTQQHYGNGGLGVCVATVVSEVCLVGLGIALSPRGLIDRALLLRFAKVALASLVMVGAAWLTSSLLPLAAAAISVTAYFLVLLASGGLDQDQLATARAALGRKVQRA